MLEFAVNCIQISKAVNSQISKDCQETNKISTKYYNIFDTRAQAKTLIAKVLCSWDIQRFIGILSTCSEAYKTKIESKYIDGHGRSIIKSTEIIAWKFKVLIWNWIIHNL